MSRDCFCGRSLVGSYTPDQCAKCWAADNPPGVAPPTAPPIPLAAPPPAALGCAFRRAATGTRVPCGPCGPGVALPVLGCEVYGTCTVAANGAGIASCAGCARRVEPPPPARDPWRALVTISKPPVVVPKTGRTRAVVTVVTGDAGRALWAITGPAMAAYAERLHAELVVLDWLGNPAWPMSAKFGIGPAVAAFEEVIYADADILFRNTAADLFAARRDPDAVLVYNDLPHVLMHADGFTAEYQRLRESQGLKRVRVPWYANTGLAVLSRRHAPFIGVPPRPIPPLHCAEQHLWNARMHDAGVRVEWMPDALHWQWWVHNTTDGAPPSAALHFSGMGDAAERLRELRRATE